MEEMIVVCEVRGHKIGVKSAQVAEIVNLPLIKRVPSSRPAFYGLVNVRGEVVPVYDAGKLFWNEPIPISIRTQVLVLKHSKGIFGLLVDNVLDVEEASPENIEPVSGLYALIPGMNEVCKKGSEIFPLIDAQDVFESYSLSFDEEEKIDFTGWEKEFDEETFSILKNRAERLAEKPDIKKKEFKGFLLTKIGEENFALNIDNVKEIIRPYKITPVPGSPSYFKGVLTLRGEIILVVDLSLFLFGKQSIERGEQRVILISVSSETVGIWVEEVVSLVFVEEDAIEMPVHTGGNLGEIISSKIYINGKLYSILNPEVIFDNDVSIKR